MTAAASNPDSSFQTSTREGIYGPEKVVMNLAARPDGNCTFACMIYTNMLTRDAGNELVPAELEHEMLDQVGAAFTRSLQSVGAIEMGHITSSEQKFWLYYLPYHALDQAQALLEDVITDQCPDRTMGLDCEEDPEWEQAQHHFNLALRGSDSAMVTHEQRDQRAQLLLSGASMHEPMELRHRASFPDRSAARSFRDAIEKHGFGVYFHGVTPADRWEVHFKRLATLDDDFFFSLLGYVASLAHRHGGKDEGWEA
jgi:hypothetical protein